MLLAASTGRPSADRVVQTVQLRIQVLNSIAQIGMTVAVTEAAGVRVAAGLFVAQVARAFAVQASIRARSIVHLQMFDLFARDLLLFDPALDALLLDQQIIV